MTDQKTDLLPCPFCGGEADGGWWAESYAIDCPACKFEIDADRDDTGIPEEIDTLSEVQLAAIKLAAISKWNTRADLAPTVKPLEWEEKDGELIAQTIFGEVTVYRDSDSGWLVLRDGHDDSWVKYPNEETCFRTSFDAAKFVDEYTERRILSALTQCPMVKPHEPHWRKDGQGKPMTDYMDPIPIMNAMVSQLERAVGHQEWKFEYLGHGDDEKPPQWVKDTRKTVNEAKMFISMWKGTHQ